MLLCPSLPLPLTFPFFFFKKIFLFISFLLFLYFLKKPKRFLLIRIFFKVKDVLVISGREILNPSFVWIRQRCKLICNGSCIAVKNTVAAISMEVRGLLAFILGSAIWMQVYSFQVVTIGKHCYLAWLWTDFLAHRQ